MFFEREKLRGAGFSQAFKYGLEETFSRRSSRQPQQKNPALEKPTKNMEDSHKPHRAPHSGTKADKKRAKKNGTTSKKGNNPRAFTMSNSRRAEKIARRSTEVFPMLVKAFHADFYRWLRNGCMYLW